MEQQYPKCMIKIDSNVYKCALNKFHPIIVKDKNLPIICHLCPLSTQLEVMSNDNIKYPNTVQLAKNFIEAVIRYASSGFVNVNENEYKERLAICIGTNNNTPCEYYDNGRCKHVDCGCFLSKKAWWASENCPENKWPNHHDQQPDKQQGD